MNAISLNAVEELSDDERRALRASRFGGAANLQGPKDAPKAKRLAHPGGPVVTNKAAALARFLKRKLQDPEGFAALDPDLVERAVKAAKTGKRDEVPCESRPTQRNDEDPNGSASTKEDDVPRKRRRQKQQQSKVQKMPKSSEVDITHKSTTMGKSWGSKGKKKKRREAD